MTHTPPTNAVPKIIALAQGYANDTSAAEAIVLFIPGFRKDWIAKIQSFPDANLHIGSQQWILPYSEKHIAALEKVFGKHILFAFRIGWLGGAHQSDR